MSQQNIQFKAIPGQFNIDEAQGVVECFVAGIGNKDSVGDVLITGAFTKSLTRRKPRVVWGHNWNDPIGKVLEIYEVAPGDRRLPTKMLNAGIGGLYAKVQFNLNSEKGREAFANVAFFGQEQEWSIGYKTLDSIFDPNIQANILKEVELYEVSPVLHGANQLTGTISVKSDETAEKHMPGMMMPHHEGMGAGPKIVVVRQDNDDDDDDRPIFSEGLAQALGDNEKERLTRELQARSGSSIQLVSATESTAKFRRMTSDGRSVMYRIGYHTPDNYVTFMFGKPELAEGQQSSGSRTVVPSQMPSMPMQVKPGVPTGATNFVVNPEYVMPKGQDYEKSAFDQELENLAQILDETFDVKVGRTLSSRNMSKLKTVLETLQDIVSSAEKDVESKSGYIIPVQMEKAFETKQLLDPIFDYHRVESHVTEDGIVITTGVTQEFIEAIGVAEKALGRTLSGGLGKLGRAGRGAVNFDPKAWDGDGDGIVQEGTPYSRPAIPGVNDRASGGRVDVNAATRAWQNQRRSGMASRLGSDENSDEYDEAMGPPMRRPGRGMADDPVGDAASENLDRDRNAGAVRRGLSSSTGDIVSDPPENLVNDIANAAVRAVGRSGDETRLIDGAKEVLANLTDEKLRDSVGKSVSNARKRLAEMLSDEKIIEEFQSRKAIEDFMDEVGYAVQKMLDLHVSSVKKKGTSVEQEEIEEIVDNAKSKFDNDFNELVKASKEFWSKRRKPGKFERTPEEAKKEAALDRKNLMTTLREGGAPEDLESTLGSIYKLFDDNSEAIISGKISLEDLNYELEKAIEQIVENDPSIEPKELINELADALREGASKDGANPLIVALAKEFGDEKITGGDLVDYLNDIRQNSVYRPDRGRIERENIRGFASRTGADDEGKRPRLNEYELAAIEKMVKDTGLPRKLFDDLAVTERIGNPEDAFYQAQEYGLSKEKIRGLQTQYAKALKEAKGKRKGGFASRTGGGKRLSGDDFDDNDALTAKGRKKVFDYLVDNGTDKDEADSILDRWEQNDGTAEEYMQEYDKDDRDVIENIANAASSMYEDDMSSGGERQAERRKGGFSSSTGGKWKGQKPADKDIKPGADLSGADLTDTNLRGVNLTGANLKGANMEGSDLTDANLTDANLNNANLKGSNLRAANLRDANLSYADLSRADLTSAFLEGANLEEAYLRKANLTNANLTDAEMTRVDLVDANLSGANLTDAKMKRADLADADLRGAKMTGVDLGGALLEGVDLSGKDMRGAVLSGARLNGAKLGGADLRDANLQGADLAGQDLRGTDLAGANLSGANLTEAKLEGADLTDTDLTDATMPDGKPYKDSSSRGGFSSRTGGISSNPADDPRITNVKKLKEDIADVFNRFRTTPFGLSENSTGDDRIKWERFTQNRLNETDGAIEALYAYLADMRDLEDSGVELSASQRKNIKTFKEDIGTLKRYRDNALANYRKVVGDEEADRRKATFATPVNVDRPSRGGFTSETGGNPKREMDMTLAEYAELDKVLKKYMDESQLDGIGADEDMQVIQNILDKLDESSAANDSIPLTDKEIDDYMDTLTRMRDNGPVEDSGDKESIDKLIDSLKKTKDSKDGIYESDALQQAGTRLSTPSGDKSRGGRGGAAKRSRPFKSSNGTINPHKKLDFELTDSEVGLLRDELQGLIRMTDNPAPLRAIAEKLEKATNGKFSVEKEEYEEVIKEIDKMRDGKRVVTSDVVTVLEQAAESQKGKYSSSDFGGGGGFSSSTGGRKNNGAPSDIPETMQKQLIMWGRQQGGLRLVQEAIQKFDQDNGTLPASYWKRLRTMYENMGPGSASGAARRGGRRGIFGRGKDKDTDATPTRSPGFIIDDTPAPSKGPISTDGWDKVGGQMGSQPGAKLKDPKTGKEYYVKEPKSQLHAENESLVTKLYDRLGIGVGRVQVGERSGKPKIVSEWLAGSKPVNHRQKMADSKWKKAVQDSFVATAWLANWDATANPGNIVEGADGKPYIIDSGGGLLFRARGDAKGSRFGAVVGEMDSLRDKNMNSLGYEYFNDIPPAEIARQVKEIGSLSDKEIRQMVEATVTDKAKAKEISDTLIARRDYLVKNWSTGKNSGGGRRSRAGMSSSSEGYAPRNKRPGASVGMRPEDFEVRPRDGEPTGVGKGGAMGTKPDPKFTGDSFDQAKPEEWDELTIDEKWGWMLGEGNPEKGGTMSPAAYEGAMKKLGEEEAREELKQMTPEERRKARSASRASALSELSDNEKARLATEKEERQKRAQESSKRVKEEATAEAAQSKREKLLDAFNEWIDDSIRELSGMDYDETDINPDSEDIWDTVSTILGVEDITPKSLKEAIDELSSYVDITSGENAYEKKSLARANALLKKLLKMQSEYSEDKWFNAGEGGRSGFQSSTGDKPRPPRGIRPRPGTPEMPQSNAKREGDIKRLSTLIEQVVAELEAKRQNPSPKKGRMGFSSSTGKTMITDEATFFKDVENSLAKEIRAAQKARNTKAASGLTKLQEIIKRSEASKTGDRRTNTGSIYMTMDEVDLILDGLQFALDQQMDAGGDKRIGWYSKLIEKIAAAAMSTFIDKSTTEIGSTRRTVTNKDGVKKKINIVPEP